MLFQCRSCNRSEKVMWKRVVSLCIYILYIYKRKITHNAIRIRKWKISKILRFYDIYFRINSCSRYVGYCLLYIGYFVSLLRNILLLLLLRSCNKQRIRRKVAIGPTDNYLLAQERFSEISSRIASQGSNLTIGYNIFLFFSLSFSFYLFLCRGISTRVSLKVKFY